MEMMRRNSGHDVLLGSVLALAVFASFLALAVLLVELSYDADAPTEEFMPNGTARPMSLRYFCLALCRTSTVRSENDSFRTNIWYLDQRRVILPLTQK
ncbi:hypothetical protein CQ10_24305 [Bradyrhizobium valentinum]|uniref:Uncharacterized protein n=1 Tax=Bradyrhizobium valentinum TaxID=1518501 RepID=A0A0R3KZ49_9BRAD|nr:hypothetical protein CQ10_24305 [Bradyrhizobium valentinum]KRR02125.1 hypothetical protein CP49_04950 [Bradyrhizobium valentinum]